MDEQPEPSAETRAASPPVGSEESAQELRVQLAAAEQQSQRLGTELANAKQRAVKRIRSQLERIEELEAALKARSAAGSSGAARDGAESSGAWADAAALDRLCTRLHARAEMLRQQHVAQDAARDAAHANAVRELRVQLAHQLEQVKHLSASLHASEHLREQMEEEHRGALAAQDAALLDAQEYAMDGKAEIALELAGAKAQLEAARAREAAMADEVKVGQQRIATLRKLLGEAQAFIKHEQKQQQQQQQQASAGPAAQGAVDAAESAAMVGALREEIRALESALAATHGRPPRAEAQTPQTARRAEAGAAGPSTREDGEAGNASLLAARREVAAVRARARKLMEEKEAELAALRARLASATRGARERRPSADSATASDALPSPASPAASPREAEGGTAGGGGCAAPAAAGPASPSAGPAAGKSLIDGLLPERELMDLASRQAERDAAMGARVSEAESLRGELAAERRTTAGLRRQLQEAARRERRADATSLEYARCLILRWLQLRTDAERACLFPALATCLQFSEEEVGALLEAQAPKRALDRLLQHFRAAPAVAWEMPHARAPRPEAAT